MEAATSNVTHALPTYISAYWVDEDAKQEDSEKEVWQNDSLLKVNNSWFAFQKAQGIF